MYLNFKRKIIYSTLLIIPILLLGCRSNADSSKIAPDFTLKDLSGNSVSLQQYRGKVVLLDFWATWCQPCRYSIPELVEIQDKYRDKGLVVIGISVDNPREVNNKYISAFKEKYKVNYTIVRTDTKTTATYFGKKNFPIPTIFLINREGMIVNKHQGFIPGAVEKLLTKILK
jgi:cytochrome c biogenesis protein CcmG/thiol:disulfide interchange protein DsbE